MKGKRGDDFYKKTFLKKCKNVEKCPKRYHERLSVFYKIFYEKNGDNGDIFWEMAWLWDIFCHRFWIFTILQIETKVFQVVRF